MRKALSIIPLFIASYLLPSELSEFLVQTDKTTTYLMTVPHPSSHPMMSIWASPRLFYKTSCLHMSLLLNKFGIVPVAVSVKTIHDGMAIIGGRIAENHATTLRKALCVESTFERDANSLNELRYSSLNWEGRQKAIATGEGYSVLRLRTTNACFVRRS